MNEAPEASGVRWERDDDGIVHVVFDRPGEKVNLLTPEILVALEGWLELWRREEAVRGLLFRSDKPGMFLAGVDVEAIAAVREAHQAAEAARFGQRVLGRIADFPWPSACAIRGVCLGGGTELALACTWRLAADDPSVQIGLPEVQLGIIPGFGGTQRLPRLVGLGPSLELVLAGRAVDARRALRIGLVDALVPEAYLVREARRWLLGQAPARRRAKHVAARLVETVPPLRRYVLAQARKRTAARVRELEYPAPFRALEALEAALTRPLPEGLDIEARIVGELVASTTSKNLIWLFKTQTARKRTAGTFAAPPRDVRRAAVLGAGIMGSGIAYLLADRGIPVRLRDVRPEALLEAARTAAGLWRRRVEQRRIGAREARQRLGYLSLTLDWSGLRHVDLVIEAVVEDLQVKRDVLAEVERRTSERAVFASNTSSIPITEIAARALHPERVVGLHFFNPVPRMPLVEIVAGERTSPEALATVHALAVRLGKTPVVVRDRPGFLVNRILMPYLNEALLLVGEGVSIEAVDRAMTGFGMPVGPLALLDQVGLDTALHVARVLAAAFPVQAASASPLLEKMVADGRLGVKSGRGFYRYDGQRRRGPDESVYPAAGAGPRREIPPEMLQERMILAIVNEAARCLEEGVVGEPQDVDVALVLGTGFPPFRGGILRWADATGVPVITDRLVRLAEALGERFAPAPLLREMVREQRRFYEGEPAPAPSLLHGGGVSPWPR